MAQRYPALVPQGKLLCGVPIGLPVPLLTSWLSLKYCKSPGWLLLKAGLPGPVIRMVDWRLSLGGQTLAAYSVLVATIACTFCANARVTIFMTALLCVYAVGCYPLCASGLTLRPCSWLLTSLC